MEHLMLTNELNQTTGIRTLSDADLDAVSGGEYLDYQTLNAVKDFMKVGLKPSKIFDGKFPPEAFNITLLPEYQANLDAYLAQQG